jgi:hypothetical protein
MIVDGEELVFPCGIAPVDHVQVYARFQEILDHAAFGLQIEHGLPIDEGIDHEQGNGYFPGRFAHGKVVLQPDPVLLVDDLVRRGADLRFQRPEQHLGSLLCPVLCLVRILREVFQDYINRDLGGSLHSSAS